MKTGIHSGSPLTSPMHGNSPQDVAFHQRLGENVSGLGDLCHPGKLGGSVVEEWFGCTFNNMGKYSNATL